MTLTCQLVDAGMVAADLNRFSAVELRWRHEPDAAVAVVQRYGETTDTNSQLQALAHYGVTARLMQKVDFALLEGQNDARQAFQKAMTTYYTDAYLDTGGRNHNGFSESQIEVKWEPQSRNVSASASITSMPKVQNYATNA